MAPKVEKILYFEWSPPWHFFVIVSDISFGNIYGIIFWHSILAFYLAFYLTVYSGILSGIYSDILSGILCVIYTDIFSCIFSAICSGIRSGMLYIWHSIWHSFLAFYLACILTFFPGILSSISSEILCGWGPAGNTLILGLLFGCGREHCDLALAVEVRRGTLWSWACSWGPAGNTLILGLQLRSGGGTADIKSNNPHLTGGEKKVIRAWYAGYGLVLLAPPFQSPIIWCYQVIETCGISGN